MLTQVTRFRVQGCIGIHSQQPFSRFYWTKTQHPWLKATHHTKMVCRFNHSPWRNVFTSMWWLISFKSFNYRYFLLTLVVYTVLLLFIYLNVSKSLLNDDLHFSTNPCCSSFKLPLGMFSAIAYYRVSMGHGKPGKPGLSWNLFCSYGKSWENLFMGIMRFLFSAYSNL